MPEASGPVTLALTPLNWYLLGAAAVVIVAGFVLLGRGTPLAATVLAPVLLVLGYVVLIPLGLIVHGPE